MFRRISQYITEIKSELKKCSWPWDSDPKVRGFRKYRELSGSTIVVLIAMVLLGAYVSLFDLILAAIVNGTITGLS